jgi:hypothetical protein
MFFALTYIGVALVLLAAFCFHVPFSVLAAAFAVTAVVIAVCRACWGTYRSTLR